MAKLSDVQAKFVADRAKTMLGEKSIARDAVRDVSKSGSHYLLPPGRSGARDEVRISNHYLPTRTIAEDIDGRYRGGTDVVVEASDHPRRVAAQARLFAMNNKPKMQRMVEKSKGKTADADRVRFKKDMKGVLDRANLPSEMKVEAMKSSLSEYDRAGKAITEVRQAGKGKTPGNVADAVKHPGTPIPKAPTPAASKPNTVPNKQRVITLGDGRNVTLRQYIEAWRMAKALPPSTRVRGSPTSTFRDAPNTAGDAVQEFRLGIHDRINRHLPGFEKGRKWDYDWQGQTRRMANEVNEPRVRVQNVQPEYVSRLRDRLGEDNRYVQHLAEKEQAAVQRKVYAKAAKAAAAKAPTTTIGGVKFAPLGMTSQGDKNMERKPAASKTAPRGMDGLTRAERAGRATTPKVAAAASGRAKTSTPAPKEPGNIAAAAQAGSGKVSIPRMADGLGRLKFDPISEPNGAFGVSPAKYAKGKVAISVSDSASGMKGRVSRLADAIDARWSRREKAYIASPAQAEKLMGMYAEGKDANLGTNKRGQLGYVLDDPKKSPSGWSDAAREASAEARGVALPGEAKAKKAAKRPIVSIMANNKYGSAPSSMSQAEKDARVTKGGPTPNFDATRAVVEKAASESDARSRRAVKAAAIRNAAKAQTEPTKKKAARTKTPKLSPVEKTKAKLARQAASSGEAADVAALLARQQQWAAQQIREGGNKVAFDPETYAKKLNSRQFDKVDLDTLQATQGTKVKLPNGHVLNSTWYKPPTKTGGNAMEPLAKREGRYADWIKKGKPKNFFSVLGPAAIVGAGAVAYDATRNQAMAAGKTSGQANLNAAGAAAIASGSIAAIGYGVSKAVSLAARAAPVAGKALVRALPVAAAGLAAYEIGRGAVQGYRQGGVGGAIKGAGTGALDFATVGAYSHFSGQAAKGEQGRLSADQQRQYADANASYTAMQQAKQADGSAQGWSDQARIAAYISRVANAGGTPDNLPYGGALRATKKKEPAR